MNIGKSLGLISPSPWKNFQSILTDYCHYSGISRSVKEELSGISKLYGHVFDVPTMIGLEIEVENIKKDLPLPDFWMGEGDGSLRNGGKEFKTIPLTPEQAFSALVVLWQIINKMTNAQADFSWRTSIHVHLNVIELEPEELKKLLILSLIFEDLFFELVGKDREQSIFCVPINQSTHLYSLRGWFRGDLSMKNCFQNWHKYSAVNLSRLVGGGHDGAIGTVEFRHLGGTNELSVVSTWLSLLLQLYKAAITIPEKTLRAKIMDLNTSSKYLEFAYSVFTPEVANRFQVKNFPKLFSKTISRAKEVYAMPPAFGPLSPESSMFQHLEAIARPRQDALQEAISHAAKRKAAAAAKGKEDFNF